MFFRLLLAAGILCLASGFPASAVAQTNKVQSDLRRKQMKAEHDRRVAEMQRKMGQATPSHRAAAGVAPSQFSPAASANRTPQWNSPKSSTLRLPEVAKQPDVPPFNASQAPPPAECLWKYVAAVKSASTMEQVLPYLPAGEARSLRDYQATYDPKQAAKSRQSLKQLDPKLTEDGLTHLTNSPYVNALKWHKGIAEDILEVLSVKIEGNKATLRVSTTNEAIIDGGRFPYGTATIELEGEGNTWKIGAYNDSNVYYQEPPKK